MLYLREEYRTPGAGQMQLLASQPGMSKAAVDAVSRL